MYGHPHISSLLFLVLHRCKLLLPYTPIHETSEIPMDVALLSDIKRQVLFVAPPRIELGTNL